MPHPWNKRRFPILEPLGGGRWKVLENWYYTFAGKTRVILAGTITDLATMPPFLRVIFLPDGKYRGAVVEHDDLYGNDYFGQTREDADLHMKERMAEDRCKKITQVLFYSFVRGFGGLHRIITRTTRKIKNKFQSKP